MTEINRQLRTFAKVLPKTNSASVQRDVSLETSADPEARLPVMRSEAAGFVCRHEVGGADSPPRIANQTIAEVESENEATRGVILNDTAKIDVQFGTGGTLVRKDTANWLLHAKRVAAKMNKARPRL